MNSARVGDAFESLKTRAKTLGSVQNSPLFAGAPDRFERVAKPVVRFASNNGQNNETAGLKTFDLTTHQQGLLLELLPNHVQKEASRLIKEAKKNLVRVDIGVNRYVTIVTNDNGREKATQIEAGTPLNLNAVTKTSERLARGFQCAGAEEHQEKLSSLINFIGLEEAKTAVTQAAAKSDPRLEARNRADFQKLVKALPPQLQSEIQRLETQNPNRIEEIELDMNRPARVLMNGKHIYLENVVITKNDLNFITSNVGAFGAKDRAGLEGALHRISPLRNRSGEITGLTLRIGRALDVNIDPLLADLNAGKSLLILGEPGVGKTTLLRKISRHMADLERIGNKPINGSVLIVDTSNEIAGDGDEPHPFIGKARRLQVPSEDRQYELMRRAVQNHRAKVVVIDEIGLYKEAESAAVIAKNGGMLIATAHGNDFNEFIENKELAHLMGNPKPVTVGDELVSAKGLTSKTQIERSCKPAFKTLLVMKDRYTGEYYPDFEAAVDAKLQNKPYKPVIIHFSKSPNS